jgi:hypothetical protein
MNDWKEMGTKINTIDCIKYLTSPYNYRNSNNKIIKPSIQSYRITIFTKTILFLTYHMQLFHIPRTSAAKYIKFLPRLKTSWTYH